jgi:hypothetical protein
MVSHPSKRTRPPVNVQALPLTDQQILQRAAALLNKSVADLVQGPGEDSSQAYATPASQSYTMSDTYEGRLATPHPDNTQPWLSEAHLQQQTQSQPSPYVEQAVQMSFGGDSQVERFGPDLWSSMQIVSTPRPQNSFLPQNEFSHPAPKLHRNNSSGHSQVFEMDSSRYSLAEAVSPTSHYGQSSNHDGNEIEIIGTDSSSEISENDTEGFNAQPWENIQINAVEQLVSSENDPDSDYLWLDDPENPPLEGSHNSSQSVTMGAQLREFRGGRGRF